MTTSLIAEFEALCDRQFDDIAGPVSGGPVRRSSPWPPWREPR
jgi:hypothetical protein